MTCPASKRGLNDVTFSWIGLVSNALVLLLLLLLLLLSGGGPGGPDPCGDGSPEEAGAQADVWGVGAPLPGLEPQTQAGESSGPTEHARLDRYNRLHACHKR